jgi:sugar phosphate isomerase/epimerase
VTSTVPAPSATVGATASASLPTRPRISLSTSSTYPEPTEYAFEMAAKLGFDGVEVMVITDAVSQDAHALADLSRAYELPIVSIHAPCLIVTQFVWGSDPEVKLRRSVDMARDLGSDVVVVHPPFRWQRDYALGFTDLVDELSARGDVKVAVENMFPWAVPGRKVAAYAPHWDPREQTYADVTLDISHCAAAGVDCLDMASDLGSRLRHLHLTDGSGSARDEHLVLGRGRQPVGGLISKLAAVGFDGHYVVEINTRKASDRAAREVDLAESMGFLRARLLASGRFALAGTPDGTFDLAVRSSAQG